LVKCEGKRKSVKGPAPVLQEQGQGHRSKKDKTMLTEKSEFSDGITCAKTQNSTLILSHELAIQSPILMNLYFFLSILHAWQLIKIITDQAGGARISLELGSYMSENGHLMLDFNVWITFNIAQDDLDKYRVWMIDLACHTRAKLRQEAVALVIDGAMSFY